MTAPTLVHAPCLCCGGDLCLSRVLDVWAHETPAADRHLPQPDVQHQHEETK